MPPIEARPTREYLDHPVYGSQWGIYATAPIASNVFIAEYGCDLLQGSDLVLCRKSDSIMRFSEGGSAADVFLAPKDYAGLAILVNSGTKA